MSLAKQILKQKWLIKKCDNVRIFFPNPDQILNCPFGSLHNYKAQPQNEEQWKITH